MGLALFRRKRASSADRLRGRGSIADAERIELADVVPDAITFLGQLAALQFDAYESFARAGARAETLTAKLTISLFTKQALERHEQLSAELLALGAEPVQAMTPVVRDLGKLHDRAVATSWQELVFGTHIRMGILNDFFRALAHGLEQDLGARVGDYLVEDAAASLIELLQAEIELDKTLTSRLALWGRRMVGDVLLTARAALSASARDVAGSRTLADIPRIEPVVTEIIAAHTRRMDELGLTA